MAITEISIIHHVAIVLFLLWLLHASGYGRPILYFLSFLYVYQVNESYARKLNRRLRFEQRRRANQRRVLLESETVRWLNHAIEKIWPICMEEIMSKKVFQAIIPWFLDKYKPWTVEKAVIEHLYMGRKPPMFTEMRVLNESSDDDHLVLELGLNFLTADDMSVILLAKLQKALALGIVAKMHITSMHVEGKVLVGVKFMKDWPYISRLRICFAEPPYFQMTVKPIFNHGVDVTEIPGIAGWLDNLLAVAFEQTLVQPNMLVIDVEKFVSPNPSPQQSPRTENWFSMSVKDPLAYAVVEVIEGSDMKPSDPNGLADPYVKGQIGSYRFKTKIQRKTLSPKWLEEFKIPICSWESDNVLAIEARDKDPFMDDNLGVCSVDINGLRGGQRHDMWISLENIKMGRLHLAITVIEASSKEMTSPTKNETKGGEDRADSPKNVIAEEGSGFSPSGRSSRKSQLLADTFEPIDVEGQKETGIWIHHPGSNISQTWEPRKGRSISRSDTEIQREIDSTTSKGSEPHNTSDELKETSHHPNIFDMGFQMLNNAFNKSQKRGEMSISSKESLHSPQANVKAADSNRAAVKHVAKDGITEHSDATLQSTGSKSLSKKSEEENDTNSLSPDERSASLPLHDTVGGGPIA